MHARLLPICAAAVLAAALGACSSSGGGGDSGGANGTSAAAPVNARARQSLKLYNDLRAKGSYALAAPIGEGVVKRHPGSAAAKEIQRTLADTQKRAAAINETRRLAGLWLYQSGEQSGGTQHTASLKPSQPASARDHIELVLRRHSDWGQSVYLYDHGGKGFVCKGHCTLQARFDGEPRKLDAFRPQTHDPAIFIQHDKRFIAALEKAKVIEITVQPRDGASETLKFEVSGFDPARWPKL
ncbi:MAG TPA: hypothetical protein VFG73_07695 [Rhodanobacteraceae bacterium]|nr:hypothetical protein [Rhodanobacteraceae bacterium]